MLLTIGQRSHLLVYLLLLFGSVTVTAQQTAVIGRSFPGSPQFSLDSDGAVGPSHYAEITNRGLRVTELSTGVVVYSSTLYDFWGTKVGIPVDAVCCDSRIAYDHATGRWIAITLSGVFTTHSSIYVGISDTSDPSDGWKGLVIDADPSDLRWADLPKLGVDGSAVYVTAGMVAIAPTTSFGRALYVLPKTDLTGAAPTAERISRFFTPYPSDEDDFYYDADPIIDYLGTSKDGLHLAAFGQPTYIFEGSGYRWGVDAVYQRMTGQTSGTATLLPWVNTPLYLFDSMLNPQPQPPPADFGRQPGTSIRLNNGSKNSNKRIGDAVYDATSSAVLGRFGIVWRRFQPSTNTIVDAGFIGDDVNDYLSPSIAANANGDVVIAYLRTSPTEHGSFYYSAGRPDASGKLVFGPPTLVKAGSDIYDENGPLKSPGIARFVDYASAVSVHPLDPSRFWISGPYVSSRNVGSTWVAEVVVNEAVVTAVTSATGEIKTAFAPGDFLTAYGNYLCGYIWDSTTGLPLPAETMNQPPFGSHAGRCRVLVNGQVAPIHFGITWAPDMSSQANFILPDGVEPGKALVVFERLGENLTVETVSDPFEIQILGGASPAFFKVNGIVIQQNFSQDLTGGTWVTEDTPASVGDWLTTYSVGWGGTNPPVTAGGLPEGLAIVDTQFQVWSFDGVNHGWVKCPVYGDVVVASPQFPGVFQLSFQIPEGIAIDSEGRSHIRILYGNEEHVDFSTYVMR